MKKVVSALICFLIGVSLCYAGSSKEICKILARIRKAMEAPKLEIIAERGGYFYQPKIGNKGKIEASMIRFIADSSGKWRSESEDGVSMFDGKYWWKYVKSKNAYSKQKITQDFANFTKHSFIKMILSGFPLMFTYNENDPDQKKLWDFAKATLIAAKLDGRKALLLTVPSYKEACKMYSSETKEMGSASTLTFKVWVDPKTYLPLQIQMEEKTEKSKDPEWQGAMHIYISKIIKFSLNPSIKKETFLFIPPEGAREVSPAELTGMLMR
ncbi:DUF2092 domain-containing protein [bacterium]|nr:DUF2092 domain-containing protein [bacterium]